MGAFQDLTGQKFGRLTVIERRGRDKWKNAIWLCECECGNTKLIAGTHLIKGRSKSCGCLQVEKAKERATTHGLSHSRIYRIWFDMKRRCNQSQNKSYDRYGGKGVKVCDEWTESFQSFYDWSMKNGYTDNLTIDRIDSNGDYSPSNCRWVDEFVQANNRSNNHYITYKGETKTMKQWSDVLGIGYYVLRSRFNKGWDVERAFHQPVRGHAE